MKIYNNTNLNLKHLNGVIAVGNFDGLHVGHQKVINEALKDKINEMNIDNLDKDTLIEELTNRYKIELEKLRSQLDIYKKLD